MKRAEVDSGQLLARTSVAAPLIAQTGIAICIIMHTHYIMDRGQDGYIIVVIYLLFQSFYRHL